jgi:hypothetical protein
MLVPREMKVEHQGGAASLGEAHGGVTMARVLNEILAYSYMAAFITGIVVLAAATFIS